MLSTAENSAVHREKAHCFWYKEEREDLLRSTRIKVARLNKPCGRTTGKKAAAGSMNNRLTIVKVNSSLENRKPFYQGYARTNSTEDRAIDGARRRRHLLRSCLRCSSRCPRVRSAVSLPLVRSDRTFSFLLFPLTAEHASFRHAYSVIHSRCIPVLTFKMH
ncbi:hypothetical protein PUN28_012585 [Cardiocondyla obscurior]|uniref:Uncharacterized protein n=1 Tax=Cardiocondyla obscurior TaxID=286306 RepID=A0AAW2FEX8_9HYME